MDSKLSALKPYWDIAARPYTYTKEALFTKLPKNRRSDMQTKVMAGTSAAGMALSVLSLLGGSPLGALLVYGITVGVTYGRDPKFVNKNNTKADANDPLKKALGDDFSAKVKNSKEAGYLRKTWDYVAAPYLYVKETHKLKKTGSTLSAATKRADLATKIGFGITALGALAGAYPIAAGVYAMTCLYSYGNTPQGSSVSVTKPNMFTTGGSLAHNPFINKPPR